MLDTFLFTLTPISTLFIFMGIGFLLSKLNILPKESSRVLSKLVVWVFYPCLCFITTAKHCTINAFAENAIVLLFSATALTLAIAISYFLVPFFAKRSSYEAGIYRYALTFANSGYLGDPLVLALFGEEILFYYKIFTLPISFAIYTWGIGILTPDEAKVKSPFLKLLNPSNVGLLLGIIVGLTGIYGYFPDFLVATLESLKNCLGPCVMLLAGCSVSLYSLKNMLKSRKVYIATALRMVIIPTVLISVLYFLTLGLGLLGVAVSNSVLYLAFFAFATPLGLNTVVYPESFGSDAEPGAAMALISHTLSVISIPLLYTLMTIIFGTYA